MYFFLTLIASVERKMFLGGIGVNLGLRKFFRES